MKKVSQGFINIVLLFIGFLLLLLWRNLTRGISNDTGKFNSSGSLFIGGNGAWKAGSLSVSSIVRHRPFVSLFHNQLYNSILVSDGLRLMRISNIKV